MIKLPATTESSTKPSVSLIISQLISNHPKQLHLLRAPSNTVLAGKLDGEIQTRNGIAELYQVPGSGQLANREQ